MARQKPSDGPVSVLPSVGLTDVYADLQKEYGDNRIFWGTDERLVIQKLPLGIESLDRALGGGFAYGRFALLYGEWSSGKSLVSLLAAKAAQEKGQACVYVDMERTFDPGWAEVLGVNTQELLVLTPRTGEEAFAMLADVCRARVGVAVLDSIAACVPAVLLEGEKDPLGALARLVNAGLVRVNAVNDTTAVILLNQMREGIGVMFGDPRVLPGGKGQHFYPSLKVRVVRGAWIEEKDEGRKEKRRVGYNLRVVTDKNKQGGSHQFDEGEVPFLFSGIIDKVAGLVPLALDLGLVKQDGAHYVLFDERIYGRRRLAERIAEDSALQGRLRKAVSEVPEF